MRGWRRHLYHRRECIRTTWKLRLAVLALVILAGVATGGFWTRQIAHSLSCAQDVAPSDVLLVENFDPDYLLFERAATLEQAGFARRVLVPVQGAREPGAVNPVSQGIAEVMARQARITVWATIPIPEVEPISLNAAYRIRDHLTREDVRSLIVVSPGFRSRRSALVYRTVLGERGIAVRCDPVFRRSGRLEWTDTWHGIQTVVEEFLKLQYYRFYVIPFVFERGQR
jgi:hypothetical protein